MVDDVVPHGAFLKKKRGSPTPSAPRQGAVTRIPAITQGTQPGHAAILTQGQPVVRRVRATRATSAAPASARCAGMWRAPKLGAAGRGAAMRSAAGSATRCTAPSPSLGARLFY